MVKTFVVTVCGMKVNEFILKRYLVRGSDLVFLDKPKKGFSIGIVARPKISRRKRHEKNVLQETILKKKRDIMGKLWDLVFTFS